MPDTDEDLFQPVICPVPLGSHTVLYFYHPVKGDEESSVAPCSARLAAKLFVPRRSLLVLTGNLYFKFLLTSKKSLKTNSMIWWLAEALWKRETCWKEGQEYPWPSEMFPRPPKWRLSLGTKMWHLQGNLMIIICCNVWIHQSWRNKYYKAIQFMYFLTNISIGG